MINNYTLCFICEEGYLHQRVDRIKINPPFGSPFTVKGKYAVCPECGTEVQTMMESDSNIQNLKKLSGRFNQIGQRFVKI